MERLHDAAKTADEIQFMQELNRQKVREIQQKPSKPEPKPISKGVVMIEIMMRPSIVGKLVGALASAGLSIYNIASSSDQVLIRSANPSSSRTEVRVFESP